MICAPPGGVKYDKRIIIFHVLRLHFQSFQFAILAPLPASVLFGCGSQTFWQNLEFRLCSLIVSCTLKFSCGVFSWRKKTACFAKPQGMWQNRKWIGNIPKRFLLCGRSQIRYARQRLGIQWHSLFFLFTRLFFDEWFGRSNQAQKRLTSVGYVYRNSWRL